VVSLRSTLADARDRFLARGAAAAGAPPASNVRAARIIAVLADAVQMGLAPVFLEGALSAFNDALDVVVGAAMVWLLGWHPAFLPAFAAELMPLVDLFPTWTGAVLFVTRGSLASPVSPSIVVEPRVQTALPPPASSERDSSEK
jgi:hypothetical protein